MVGKSQNGFNNYCVGNESCTQCHAGYGWLNDDFDQEAEENVYCLVCHDGTGIYKKSASMFGHLYYEDTQLGDFLSPAIDLKVVVKSVGAPKRENCFSCHVNGVKHGDTDMSLVDPLHSLDVHMSPEKLNFSCQTCHKTSGHEISGRYKGKKALIDHKQDMDRIERDGKNVSCELCHGSVPHKECEINNHTSYLLSSLQILTGFAFYFFSDLIAVGIIGHIDLIAIVHTFCAYSLLSFIVIHIYMTIFGHKLTSHIKAMITGKEEIE